MLLIKGFLGFKLNCHNSSRHNITAISSNNKQQCLVKITTQECQSWLGKLLLNFIMKQHHKIQVLLWKLNLKWIYLSCDLNTSCPVWNHLYFTGKCRKKIIRKVRIAIDTIAKVHRLILSWLYNHSNFRRMFKQIQIYWHSVKLIADIPRCKIIFTAISFLLECA